MDAATALRRAADAADRKAAQAQRILDRQKTDALRAIYHGQIMAFETMAGDLRWLADSLPDDDPDDAAEVYADDGQPDELTEWQDYDPAC